MGITGLFRRLGEILVRERLTTPDVVEQALVRQRTTGERIGEALVSLGAVKDDDVLRALAQQQGLSYLTRDELPAPLPIVKNLSPKYLRQYAVCPVSVEGSLLTIATADPLNPIIVDDLAQSTGLTVRVVVSPFVTPAFWRVLYRRERQHHQVRHVRQQVQQNHGAASQPHQQGGQGDEMR